MSKKIVVITMTSGQRIYVDSADFYNRVLHIGGIVGVVDVKTGETINLFVDKMESFREVGNE